MSGGDEGTDLAPAAYRRGTQRFMGLELFTLPGVLVPRGETELLARTAIAKLAARDPKSLRVVDMCCGSGNLACAIASHVPTARLWASDLTDPCIELAKRNVEHLELGKRVTVVQGDLFAGLSGAELEGTIDLVVCNPPYISSGRLEQREDLAVEPREAFDGGPYGLSIHQRVVKDALAFLKPGGWLLFEFGLGQHRQLKILFERSRSYPLLEFVNDEAGEPRVACARRSEQTS
jgi:release factor glutamine methyltransferase